MQIFSVKTLENHTAQNWSSEFIQIDTENGDYKAIFRLEQSNKNRIFGRFVFAKQKISLQTQFWKRYLLLDEVCKIIKIYKPFGQKWI